MAVADVQPPPQQENKFSRYRSVRQAATAKATPPPAMDEPAPPDSIARSMSRYRRARPATAPQGQAPPQLPTLEPHHGRVQGSRDHSGGASGDQGGSRAVSASKERTRSASHAPPSRSQRAQEPYSGGQRDQTRAKHQEVSPSNDHTAFESPNAAAAAVKGSRGGKDESARRREEQKSLRQKQLEDTEFDERLKEIKRQELERLERELSAARPAVSPPSPDTPKKEKRGFFGRMKSSKAATTTTSAPFFKPEEPQQARKAPVDAAHGIEPGGGGIVPGIDAPISAVNAGERRVKIKCNDAFINLPVLPETTSTDLIHSACNCLNQPIRPETSLLVESFTQLGLERPLRRYEHIREILNSWDRDTQNGLLLVPTASEEEDQTLKVACVPAEPPEVSVYLYYSQKPRKWDKRWVTLRPDGQMVVAKNLESKDKDLSSICHLSDFDIYNPTRRQISKVLRPPKKMCFAIKSQQKSSMFLSTANFVHFFATSDKNSAAQFFQAVQGWRSWYLVHKKGDGQVQRSKGTSERNHVAGGSRQIPQGKRTHSSSRRNASADDSPYQIGSMKPFITSQDINPSTQDHLFTTAPPDTSSGPQGPASKTLHVRDMSTRERRAPPVSFPGQHSRGQSQQAANNNHLVQGVSPDEVDAATFAPTGLLGRSYTQRQKAHHERERSTRDERPFTDGPNLLNGEERERDPIQGPPIDDAQPRVGRTSSVRSSQHNGTDLRRGSSQRQKPKPLLDFSKPEYKEPPQHLKKSRGHLPAHIPPGGNLIDAATSPDVPIAIPPSSSWRRPSGAQAPPTQGRTNTLRHRPHTSADAGGARSGEHLLRNNSDPNNRSDEAGENDLDHLSPDSGSGSGGEIDAFTGLLGQLDTSNKQSQGGTGTGRGVRTGDRAAKGPPMLDMREQSRFTPGSLLSRVERERQVSGSGSGAGDGLGPTVIDREKRREVSIGVGEGY